MKDLNLLVRLTQLGLSTAFPPAVFSVLGVWLHRSAGWGIRTVWAGVILGLICAVRGFQNSLKAMDRMYKTGHQEQPSVSFHEHQ